MSYNIMDRIQKMKVTLPMMEVTNIFQQKENFIKAIEDKNPRGSWLEVAVISQKLKVTNQKTHLGERSFHFFYLCWD